MKLVVHVVLCCKCDCRYVGRVKRFIFICYHGICSALQNEPLRKFMHKPINTKSFSSNISAVACKNPSISIVETPASLPEADSSISSHYYSIIMIQAPSQISPKVPFSPKQSDLTLRFSPIETLHHFHKHFLFQSPQLQ